MDFHQSIIQELKKTKAQAEKAIAQLSDDDLHWQPEPESNSIAIIMKHIAGNLLSRWTDFLTTDGEKPDRNRDGEFVDAFRTRAELLEFWERGWARLFETLKSLKSDNLARTVQIRGEPHSVPLAMERSLGHT